MILGKLFFLKISILNNTSYFLNRIYFLFIIILFYFLISLPRTYDIMLNKGGENELTSLVLYGKKKVLSIPPFSLMLAVCIL